MNAMMWPWLSGVERYPKLSGFRPILGEDGMVSSPHAKASAVGVEVLRKGGNAVDAAIATSAALMVLLPMQCGLGGDAFWLIASPRGIEALDASGRAPRTASAEQLRSSGYSAVPSRSAYAVTVPGAVSGWMEAHAALGSIKLSELLRPAIEIAEQGYFLSRHGVASFRVAERDLREKGALGIWSSRGELPNLYQRIRQVSLARTLDSIGRSKGEEFYRGEIARSITETVRNSGGWLTEGDLADHTAEWVTPISTNFRGYDVFTTPASTQGFALLAALARVSSVSELPLSNFSADNIHLLVEAVGASLQDRDAFNDDRRRVGPALESLWSNDWISDFSDQFDPQRRSAFSAQPGNRTTKGDTAHLAVVDCNGMAVSLIQSLFFDFGSAIPVNTHGFTLQNRGAAFHLDEGEPGVLEGGMRPPSTLMPSILMRGNMPSLVFGCMGGDGQVQTQLQLLIDLVDDQLDVQQAISKPRWYLDRSGEGECKLLMEEGFELATREALERKGHKIGLLTRWEEIMGHAQAIAITTDKVMVGGADPRSDGQVAAL
ncbi:gamma-glutamyltransferase [Agrobacterium sp. P15N1-A]|uniref:gamma-glutamyltransferase n=1 Tax=Agrobacterium sp. P15N1-A TaxID=3342820 RepID=UPI0037D8669E